MNLYLKKSCKFWEFLFALLRVAGAAFIKKRTFMTVEDICFKKATSWSSLTIALSA